MCTLVFNQSLHRKFWLYIAEHCIEKAAAIEQMIEQGLLTLDEAQTLLASKNNCLACEYAEEMRFHDSIGACECCPFVGVHSVSENCLHGTYNNYCIAMCLSWDWCKTNDYYVIRTGGEYFAIKNNEISQEQHRKLCTMSARAIANWPVRDDVDCI